MFSRKKQKTWDDGSSWGIDTFAFLIEMNMSMGYTLEQSYNFVKTTMVNDKALETRLAAWKESNV